MCDCRRKQANSGFEFRYHIFSVRIDLDNLGQYIDTYRIAAYHYLPMCSDSPSHSLFSSTRMWSNLLGDSGEDGASEKMEYQRRWHAFNISQMAALEKIPMTSQGVIKFTFHSHKFVNRFLDYYSIFHDLISFALVIKMR